MTAILAGSLIFALIVIIALSCWGLHWVMVAYELEQDLEEERRTLRALTNWEDR